MASAVNDDTSGDRITVLTFRLEEDRYCVRADAVASVLAVNDDRSIASAADPWNAGTVSVAGDRVRVVDLPRAFTSSIRTTERVEIPKLLVFALSDDDGTHYGWLVDEVDVTRTVSTDDLEPIRTGTQLPHVNGRLEIDGDEVVWLDENAIHG